MKNAWIAKALTKQILSRIPYGGQIDYFLQRRITGSLPHADPGFLYKAELSARHIERFKHYDPTPIHQIRCLEFGAGWDLTTALTFYAMGVRNQILVDISPKVKFCLVNHVLSQSRRLAGKLAVRAPGADFRMLPARINSHNDLQALGIQYVVSKLDSCDFPEPFDLISSISTMEHIPFEDLQLLLHSCHRLLRDGGLFLAAIDTSDHYAQVDRSITHVNYLRYSESVWRIFNPPLHYQNRLRASDHLRVVKDAGFSILENTPHRIKRRPQIKIHPRFAEYIEDEIFCGGTYIVARK